MNAHFFFPTLSADFPLGRVDKFSIPQQTVMEILISTITKNKEKICGSQENPKDISEWDGVTLNGSNDIIKILWIQKNLHGSIDLKWLPTTTKRANFMSNKLTGTVDLTCLPDSLENLSLASNAFHGTVDVTQLPPGIQSLLLNHNAFYGEADFSQLPKSLAYMSISNTNVKGEIREFKGTLMTKGSYVKDLRKG